MTDNRTTELLRKLLNERGVEYEAYRDIKNRCITKWRTYHGAFVFFAVEKEGKLFVETASDTEHSAICTPEQAIAATLGSGTLTAEQVIEAFKRHCTFYYDSKARNVESVIAEFQAVADELNAELGSGAADTDDALNLLDEIREAGRISYDDYSQLFDAIAELGSEINGDTSDGYHTFNELYHHRAVLFSVIVRDHRELAWKAKKHHDGTMYDGMFIVGIETPKGQATYHYDLDPYWEMFDCEEREFAPEWDDHTPDDAIARIAELGSGTCELIDRGKFTPHHDFYRVECSECGVLFWQSHGHLPPARFCQSCGKRVRKAVER